MQGVFVICAFFSIFALGVITVFLFANGLPFMVEIGVGNFLFGTVWHPTGDVPQYGILPMIVGSLYVTALSVVLGVTLGLFTAVCLFKFVPKWLATPVRHMINLLAGIPSVIFGKSLYGANLLWCLLDTQINQSNDLL